MFYSNFPFTTSQSPLGEVTLPNKLTLAQWMNDPTEFTPGVVWEEDKVPEKVFAYGPNAKSKRYRLYNRGIQPAFALSPLLYFEPQFGINTQVGRGVLPVIQGMDMEAQARKETLERYAENVEEQVEKYEAREAARPPLVRRNGQLVPAN